MALGGGTFLSQNKILPGAYINFVSASRASSLISDRGVATMPLTLDWGADDTVITVTNQQFQEDSMKIFGYPYSHEKMKGLRDLFQNIRTGYFYKLNGGGAKASNDYATAVCSGTRGNALKIVIASAEGSTEASPIYDVSTLLDNIVVDIQRDINAVSQLKANDYVTFKADATLDLTAGVPLTGGTDGTADKAAYQAYLAKMEAYAFNVMGCLATDEAIKALFVNYTKRMRDECGVKFQTVLFRQAGADYEGIISVENGLVNGADSADAIYWVTGACAGCEINKSLTNAPYTGSYEIDTDYTQAELEDGIKAGKLMLHRVGDDVRVLEDINTFISASESKSADFAGNQTLRVLDQIGNDIAVLFNTKYLGKIPNDNAGRISLWNDIVKHHQEMQAIQAIENFSGENVTVEAGSTKKSVIITDYVTPTNAISQMYMTVIVQ